MKRVSDEQIWEDLLKNKGERKIEIDCTWRDKALSSGRLDKLWVRDTNKINKIIIHCSDSDHPDHNDISVIDEWHRQRGWVCVGYNFFIPKSKKPVAQMGRSIPETGAHCKGHNTCSIGICLAGKYKFSDEQKNTCFELIKVIRSNFCRWMEIFPHRHFNPNKTCPNFSINEIRRRSWDSWEHNGPVEQEQVKLSMLTNTKNRRGER